MRTLNMLVFLWKINYGNKIFQRLFATILSCFFIFFVINFPETALGSGADISGPVAGTVTVSLAGEVESGEFVDVFYLDGDNVLHMAGTTFCPTTIPSLEYYMVSPNKYCIGSPISCSALGVSITINSSCITFSGTDNSFTITLSGTTAIGTFTANGTGYRINSTVIPINTPIGGLSGAGDSFQIFSIVVPFGTSEINLNTSGGSGDCDLYFVNGQPPFSYFVSEGDFATENITASNPVSGTWYIALYGYTSFNGVTLTTTVTQSGINPLPDIKANGSDGSVTPIDDLSITVALDSGDNSGDNADWWILANTPVGWIYFSISGWALAASPFDALVTLQIPLVDFPSVEILKIPAANLPSGTYTFYFAIDPAVNGALDPFGLVFDLVKVVVP